MKVYKAFLIFLFTLAFSAYCESLFQVKDSTGSPVLDVSDNGLTILNASDTLMTITSDQIKAFIDQNASKGLSRSFSVTSVSSRKASVPIFSVENDALYTWEGDTGDSYMNFSPKNIFLGLSAGESATPGQPYSYSGLYNLFLGNYAGQNMTEGYFNTFTGYMAGNASSSSHHNSFYGYQAGMNNTTGSYNTAIGYQAGYEMSGGSNNNMIGYQAGYLTSSGTNNVFIGTNAGKSNSSGNYNTAIGYQAGYNLTGGLNNIFIGYESGINTTSGDNNIFLGYQSGQANSTGNDNQFMGYMCGQDNTTGSNSMFLGWKAGQKNTTGDENLFVGYNSGNANLTGFGNVIMGTYAGQNFTDGDENVMIGRGAGAYASTTCNNNVFLGSYAGYGNGSDDGNVFIGYQVGYANVGSNKLMIDNNSSADATNSLLYGDFANDYLRINGYLSMQGLEIENLGSSNLGLDGDVVPHGGSSLGFDIGNNVAGEYWDDVVADDFINYTVKNRKGTKAMGNSLEKLIKLKPVSFKAERDKFGLIPEELEQIIPQAVVSQDIDINPDTGEEIVTETEKGIVYDQLIPVLIRSVQEQQEMINELKKEISELKNK